MKGRQLFVLSLICLLALAKSVPMHSKRRHKSHLDEAMTTLFEKPEISHCPGCTQIHPQDGIGEGDITALRVEFIKQQILKKLKLKEAPRISKSLTQLPVPIATSTGFQNYLIKEHDEPELQEEDFYGKTNQVVLFPKDEDAVCNTGVNYAKICKTFHIPGDLETDDITSAEFWVYKKADFFDSEPKRNQTFIYSTVYDWNPDQEVQKSQAIVTYDTTIKEGWIKLDLTSNVKRWIKFGDLTQTIQIGCQTCGFLQPWSPISSDPEHKSFFIINAQTNKKKRRPKRNINCSPGVSECCREKLFISFADLGWSDWIIQPRGYDAYFCRGSCTNGASITVTASGHNAIVRSYITSKERRVDLVPCCTATHLSSLEIILVENNQTISKKILPNMIVDSCGCM